MRPRHERWVERAGRVGFVAKGVQYGLLGVLALQLALHNRQAPPDQQGALTTLAQQPAGPVLLIALALGFIAYGVLRLVQALWADSSDRAKAWIIRVTGVGRAILYASLSVLAVRTSISATARSQSDESLTAALLELPLGVAVVTLVGAALVAFAAYQVYVAAGRRYRQDLELRRMSPTEERVFDVFGIAGHIGRTLVFGVAGGFLVRSALTYEPRTGVGLDGSLQELARDDVGRVVVGAVGVGLVIYAVFCALVARYSDMKSVG